MRYNNIENIDVIDLISVEYSDTMQRLNRLSMSKNEDIGIVDDSVVASASLHVLR